MIATDSPRKMLIWLRKTVKYLESKQSPKKYYLGDPCYAELKNPDGKMSQFRDEFISSMNQEILNRFEPIESQKPLRINPLLIGIVKLLHV